MFITYALMKISRKQFLAFLGIEIDAQKRYHVFLAEELTMAGHLYKHATYIQELKCT